MRASDLHQMFDPLDLELLDRVYDVAWAHIEARDLYREHAEEGVREEALRRMIFGVASTGPVHFDSLCDEVLERLAGTSYQQAP